MPSKTAKGNYHRKRTKDWLEAQGYLVEVLERTSRIMIPDKANPGQLRVLFSRRDIWGADLIARNAERLVFIQVKANAGDVSKGMKELSVGVWPASVERWVAHWPERRRSSEGPEIVEVS